jgi:hypothetical protein
MAQSVTGKFKNIKLYQERFSLDLEGIGQVGLWFNSSWKDRLEVLQPGELLTIEGQVRSVERYWVFLDNCEIVW